MAVMKGNGAVGLGHREAASTVPDGVGIEVAEGHSVGCCDKLVGQPGRDQGAPQASQRKFVGLEGEGAVECDRLARIHR